MKTNSDLEQLLDALWGDSALRSDRLPRSIKLLRSIELDAWREAREMVDKHRVPGEVDYVQCEQDNPALAEMDRIIQQLQLK